MQLYRVRIISEHFVTADLYVENNFELVFRTVNTADTYIRKSTFTRLT